MAMACLRAQKEFQNGVYVRGEVNVRSFLDGLKAAADNLSPLHGAASATPPTPDHYWTI